MQLPPRDLPERAGRLCLLTAHVVTNCAQPLALPRQDSDPMASLTTASPSTLADFAACAAASKTKGDSGSKRKPSARNAAVEGQARASQQVLVESCKLGDERTRKGDELRPSSLWWRCAIVVPTRLRPS